MTPGTRVRVLGSDEIPGSDSPEYLGTVTHVDPSGTWIGVVWDDDTSQSFPVDELAVIA